MGGGASALPAADTRIFWAGCCILIPVALWFPGDIAFVNDEAKLLANALNANEQAILARRGLMGSVGVHYGPLPTWYYQLALLFTQSPVTISLAKNLVSIGLLLAALLQLARELDLRRLPLLLTLVSPYLYFVNRTLWDDGFLVALTAWLMLCFLRFCRRGDLGALLGGIALSVVMVHTQLKSAVLLAAFYLCIALFARDGLRRHWRAALGGLLGALVLVAPYAIEVAQGLAAGGAADDSPALWRRLWFGASAAEFYSFVGWADYYLPEMRSPNFALPQSLHAGLIAISGLAVPLWLAGVYTRLRGLADHWRAGALDDLDRLSVLCLVAILLNAALCAITGRIGHPQYLYSVAMPAFFFLWSGYSSWLARPRVATLLGLQFAAQLSLWLAMIGFIHTNGGGRSIHYGATLSNQLEVVRDSLRYHPDSRVRARLENLRRFPQTYFLLRRLSGPADQGAELVDLLIEHRDPGNSYSGWIVMRRPE